MDVRQLRHFIAVAEELNFRRAAAKLDMAQPPLSQSIQKLETELGVRLFHRNSKAVQLTSAGSAFLTEAHRTLLQLERAANAARHAATATADSLRIAYIGSATYSSLIDVFRIFRESHPNVELELTESVSTEVVKLLETEQADIGVLRPIIASSKTVRVDPFEEDCFVAALPSTHKLANTSSITLSQLALEPFVIFSPTRSPTLYQQILTLCRNASFMPRIAQHARQVHTIVSLVSAGLGVALVPSAVRRLENSSVVYKPLRDTSSNDALELAIAYRTDNRTPPMEAFLTLAHKIGKKSTRPQRKASAS